MSLIEQLGGYERAKYFSENSAMIGSKREKLKLELLEHRRANNIYEKGDFVLRKDGFNNVLKITGVDNGCADLVRRVDGDPRWSRFNLTDIRHATDAEIKAGRRL